MPASPHRCGLHTPSCPSERPWRSPPPPSGPSTSSSPSASGRAASPRCSSSPTPCARSRSACCQRRGMPNTILVLGARNLGGAILDHFLSLGWRGAAVAHSADTLEAVRGRGALALDADAADPHELAEAIERAGSELG